MKTKKHNYERSGIVAGLLMGVFILVMLITGAIIGTGLNGYKISLILIIIGASILLIVAVCNMIIRYIKNKKQENFETYYEKLYEDREEIRKNKKKYYRKYQKIKFRAYFYLFFLFLVSSILGAGLIGLAFKVHMIFMVLESLLIIYQIYILSKLIIELENEGFNKIELNKYPKLKEVIQKALDISGLKIYDRIDILIFLDCNFAVSKVFDRYKLIFGLKALRSMNENEVIAVLLHEFAHVINKDVKYSEIVSKDARKWLKLRESFTGKIFFRLIGFYILRDGYKYMNAVSLEKEERADEFVAQKGYSESFNTAIYKLFMLNIHESYPFSENLFEKFEDVPKNILDEYFKIFLNIYEIKKDQWRKYIISEIEYENRTHPILSQRIKNQDLSELNINFHNIEDELKQDVENLLFKAYYNLINKETWESDRLFEYVYIKEAIDEYEKNPDNPQIPLYNIAVGYFNLNKLEQALNIFEEIIKVRKDFAAAYYYIGLIQLEQENIEGLKTLEMSAEYNYDLFPQSYSAIMNYCVFNGLKSEYDYYTKWYKSKMNVNMEIDEYKRKKKCKYVETAVTAETKNKLKEQLISLNVKKCYIVDYKFTKEYKKVCVFFNAKSYKVSNKKYYEYLTIIDAIQKLIPNARTINPTTDEITKIRSSKILDDISSNTDKAKFDSKKRKNMNN